MYDENFDNDARSDADAELKAEANELGYKSIDAMLSANREANLLRQDYENSQLTI